MYQQDSGSFTFGFIIPGQVAAEDLAIERVFHGLGVKLGLCAEAGNGQGKGGERVFVQTWFHGGSCSWLSRTKGYDNGGILTKYHQIRLFPPAILTLVN